MHSLRSDKLIDYREIVQYLLWNIFIHINQKKFVISLIFSEHYLVAEDLINRYFEVIDLGEKKMRKNLKGLLKKELVDFFKSIDEPSYRAQQIMLWIYNKKVTSFAEMTNLSKSLRQKLDTAAAIGSLRIQEIQQSRDGTRKYLFQLEDGQLIESVFIPEDRRNTLCLSSQVGCALGCTFCATGYMGFYRNLTAAEIIDQIICVSRDSGIDERISNVVIMGMGEPFLNFDNVVKSIRLMIDESSLQIGGRKITVSTSGLADKIYQFAETGLNVRLAVSLNASNDIMRSRLMPINRKFKIKKLLEATRYFFETTGSRVTFEYVLLKDLTDSLEDAKRLVELTSGFPCKVNLIPYNGDPSLENRSPSAKVIEGFHDYMKKNHPYAITLRHNRGRDILAACGQLKIRQTGI